MLGRLEGIVTDYKAQKTASRETPISSCPAYVEDIVYGTTASLFVKKEDIVLPPAEETKKKPPQKKTSCSMRLARVRDFKEETDGEHGYEYVPVDTEGCFTFGGKDYQIDMQVVPVYAGKSTREGMLYDMDKVICMQKACGDIRFFDMRLSPIVDGIKEK